jgi:hypothetical protein
MIYKDTFTYRVSPGARRSVFDDFCGICGGTVSEGHR